MRVAASAIKHGISEEASIHAASFPTWVAPLDDDPAQWRELRLGFDTHARLLETVVVVASDGDELLIHAMKARSKYVDLLR
ncbi:toxin [Corynebacterium kozikiae]|uniref:toxin n=1 Tax=Corynebacterium kozikiae TaxID=2968469 RepID=UPI00211D07EC|nr:toxin [Corynebacterium sp. 76QC2CO]MCQ9343122.1 toxin [Corynebacterium sp. 76QC2CO]